MPRPQRPRPRARPLRRNRRGACRVIDFESAWIGDPVVDFVPLRHALGSAVTEQLAQGRELGGEVARRMWFYRWMGSVHAIIYGVQEGVAEERDGGIEELRGRMVAAP